MRRSLRLFTLGLALAAGLSTTAHTPAIAADEKAAVTVAKVGDAFPDIALSAAQVEKLPGKKAGDTVKISELKGKTVVVFFYPKASTSGCTTESCGFRDIATKFPANTVLLGASADGIPAQDKFIAENSLPYPLLCDTELKLSTALGIVAANGKMTKRVTYIINGEGKIAQVYNTVAVKSHPEDVLKAVSMMKADK